MLQGESSCPIHAQSMQDPECISSGGEKINYFFLYHPVLLATFPHVADTT